MFLSIQKTAGRMSDSPNRRGRPRAAPLKTRTIALTIRLTPEEKQQLCARSRAWGVSLSKLLRTSGLGSLRQLPRFRKLPPEVQQSLTNLGKLSGAMLYLSQRIGAETTLADDLRAMVYEVGDTIRYTRQFVSQTLARQQTLTILDDLLADLTAPGADPILPDLLPRLQALRDSFARADDPANDLSTQPNSAP
jgi:hypothetical protein